MSDTAILTIQPIVAADQGQWRALWQQYLAIYQTELPDATYSETFRRILAGDADTCGCIAFSGACAIGLVHCFHHQNFWNTTPTCHLPDVFTAPEARGKNVARALIQAVFSASAKDGISDVYWLTNETNYADRILYDQVGVKTPFIVYERVH